MDPVNTGRTTGGRRSLAEQAYRHLCNRIIQGSIDYGASLNIKLIARKLGMSSMPVREAIKRLEMEGVVTIKPRSVCKVRVPTRQSILSALEMRELVEIHCVQTIYPSVTSARLQGLGLVLGTMKGIAGTAPGPSEIRKYITCDREFHTKLCALAHNPFLDKAYRETSLHLNMRYIYDIGVPPDIELTCREHLDLVEALSRNSKHAVTVIKRHLRRSRQNVLDGALFSSLRDATMKRPRS